MSFDVLRKASVFNPKQNKDYRKEFEFDVQDLKSGLENSDLLFNCKIFF